MIKSQDIDVRIRGSLDYVICEEQAEVIATEIGNGRVVCVIRYKICLERKTNAPSVEDHPFI